MTLQDRFVAALLKRGATEVLPSPTKKARTFVITHPLDRPGQRHFRYYIGRSGAVRRGETYSKSFAVSDGLKAALLKTLEDAQP